MSIRFQCPKCGKRLSAGDGYAGKEGKCACGAAIIVPGDFAHIKFRCKKCGHGISVRKAHAGKKGSCPTCKAPVAVPVPGTLLQAPPSPAPAAAPAAPSVATSADMITFNCPMCNATVKARPTSAGDIMECPGCSCFVEVPGAPASDLLADGISADLASMEETAETETATGKTVCPSCSRKLPDTSPVCTRCGIYLKTGRPILTAWDVDADELEEKAHGIVKGISWLVPFGIFPVYSEAMGLHRPYTTWAITAVTVLISAWFLLLGISGSPKMHSAKNLLLWGGNAPPESLRIQQFYMFTNYGDVAAFNAKRESLKDSTPAAQLDTAALNELTPDQQCFGTYRHRQLITHAFLHGGILHLAGNMLFLIVFGSRVNSAIGNILTAALYPILAVAAALTHLASMGMSQPTPMLGASGAIMGLAGAYLLLYPVHKIYMVIWMRWGLLAGFHLSFKCFALRGFWVVLFYIIFDVIAVLLQSADGTAHWAHIGGFVWGFIAAFVLLAARVAYSRSDILSLVLGKHAWPIIGSPAARMK
jgi:membrane associated rhomboid family serine protease